MTKESRAVVHEVTEIVDIKTQAARVWAKICEPCSLTQWHDQIKSCEPGTDEVGRLTRKYTLHAAPGRPVVTMLETELLRSDPIMTITYNVEMVNLPIENYHAQITVTQNGADACTVRLRSRFNGTIPGFDVDSLVSQFYVQGLSKLDKIMTA